MTDVAEVVHAEAVLVPSVVEAQERAQIDMQVSTAKRFPRSLAHVVKRVEELATIDQETAEACFYSLPRDGQAIEGPSVRLAEIVASSWGNLRIGTRIIDIGEKELTAQAVCHDLETNVSIQKETKRKVTNKYGKRYSEDMIVTTANAASSIALRNAVFAVIPMATLKRAIEQIKRVGMGSERTLAARRDAALTYFLGLKVTEEGVLALLNRKGREEITLEDLKTLNGIRTAIKEGTTTVEEVFAPAKGADAPKTAAPATEKLKPGRRKVEKPKPVPPKVEAPAPEPEPDPDFDREGAVEIITETTRELKGAEWSRFVEWCEAAGVDQDAPETWSDENLKAFFARPQATVEQDAPDSVEDPADAPTKPAPDPFA